MIEKIDPAILHSPEVKAAFPPTARKNILFPIITFINTLMSRSENQNSTDYLYEQRLNLTLLNLQNQITALQNAPKNPASNAISSVTESTVSISASNLLNIGALSTQQSNTSKTVNLILAALREQGLIKP